MIKLFIFLIKNIIYYENKTEHFSLKTNVALEIVDFVVLRQQLLRKRESELDHKMPTRCRLKVLRGCEAKCLSDQ